MKVNIPGDQLLSLWLLAKLRQNMNEQNNVRDNKKCDYKGEIINFYGVVSEYAFCKYYNLFFDLSHESRSGSYDCLLNGKRIDIKSTHRHSGMLIATTKINPDVDIYVLAIVEDNTVHFKGWTYKEELIKKNNLKDLGRGQVYTMEQIDLRTMNTLN